MATAYLHDDREWIATNIARARAGIHATPCTLTPNLAHLLLASNPENRNLDKRRVDMYASDIRAGRWATNGETLIVSREGLLNDGQHRCAAVIAAGRPIQTMIVFGVERETRKTTNMGKAKGAGDFAAMDGVPSANNLAAMSRLALRYEKGAHLTEGARSISHPVVLEYMHAHKDALLTSLRHVSRYSPALAGIVAVTPVAFCHYICAKISKEQADDYYYQVASGEMLVSGDPALVVRNKMMTQGQATIGKIEAMLHGWNAYRRGQKRTKINISGQLPPLV